MQDGVAAAPPSAADAANSAGAPDDAYREIAARVESLEAIWDVIASVGVSTDAHHIVFGVDAVRTDLMQLPVDGAERDPAALPKLERLLGGLETETRSIAQEIPVSKLRQGLPGLFPESRSKVVAFLDVLLPDRDGLDARSQGHLAALDYLITILATGGPAWTGKALQDPVSLTPRLCGLCEQIASEEPQEDVDAVVSTFRNAGGIDPSVPVDESELRALRRRKRELGAFYFHPTILRAVVTYNAARSMCIDQGGHDSRPWGSHSNKAKRSDADASVFGTEILPALGEALTRRHAGESRNGSAVDRVAWSLELDGLGRFERDAVTRGDVGTVHNIEGTAVLVSLLHNVSVVAEDDLPTVGIGPDQLGPAWLRELDSALKKAVHARIAADGYKDACELSDYRMRFIQSLLSPEERAALPKPAPATAPAAAPEQTPAPTPRPRSRPTPKPAQWDHPEPERMAKPLKRKKKGESGEVAKQPPKPARPWTWARTKGVIAVVGLAGLIAFATYTVLNDDLTRLSRGQLAEVSPYLVKGVRNEHGAGAAFVGTINAGWGQLAESEQERTSTELVEQVRALGVRSIMIYDRDGRLRIQAHGNGPPRIVR